MTKNVFSIVAAAAVLVGLTAQATLAENKMAPTAKSSTGTAKAHKSRGAEKAPAFNAAKDNANVKPPMAAGGKSRGDTKIAWVKVRNKTDKFVAIYVNGKGYSVVSWFGENSMPVLAGTEVKLEAKATDDDGNAVTWGPQAKTIEEDSTYTWELTE